MSIIMEDKVLHVVGNNIKTARLLKGYTQEYVAEKLNKSTNFVSILERGKSGLSIQTMVDICNILEMEPNTIFDGVIEYHHNENQQIVDDISSLSEEDRNIVIDLICYIIDKHRK